MCPQVHASLDDWAEGHHKKTEFNADLYEDVYKGHEDVLVSIRDKNPTGFHRLMADFYNDVSWAPFTFLSDSMIVTLSYH